MAEHHTTHATHTTKSYWRLWRIRLRRLRICCVFGVLVVVLALLWLNQIGLPGFLKTRLLKNLSARGVELQFSRLRWLPGRGFVADNVVVGPAQPNAAAPQLSAREVAILLNHSALFHGTLKVDALGVIGGKLNWQFEQVGQPTETLLVTNIQTQLRFLPNDQWELDNFTAMFAGARVRLSGSLTNASALAQVQGGGKPGLLRQHLRAVAHTAGRITFDEPPELDIIMHGDARDIQSFNGIVSLNAPGAQTPWGRLTDGSLLARMIPPGPTNPAPRAEFRLHAGQFSTQWASARKFHLEAHGTTDDKMTNLVRAQLEMTAGQIVTPWAQATNAQFTAFWTHTFTNAVPLDGHGELRLADAKTRWGTADDLRLSIGLTTQPEHNPPLANPNWGWWAALEPYALEWNCRLENIHADDFKSQEVSFRGDWHAPLVTITNLHTEMYQGRFDAGADLDVATRLASFSCASDFDVLKAAPLLTPHAREWFQKQEFTWEKPPVAHGSGSVVLPAWTNREPDWRSNMLPTLRLAGDFKVGEASMHQIPITSAQSHFTFSNLTWNLPDLVALRPEGRLEIAHTSDDRTSNYYFRVHSTVDIKIVRHLLPPKGQEVLDESVFSQPPIIDAELWGRWHEYDRIGGKGTITLTNVSYRAQTATYLHAMLQYTNQVLTVTDGRVERDAMFMTAPLVSFDFKTRKGYVTNGFSTMPPIALLTCIGPKVMKDLEPYQFLNPPTVQANGVIPLSDDISVADLHFLVDGGPFQWLKFRSRHISGRVDWAGKDLGLSQIAGEFYGGKLTGSAAFDFRRNEGADFHFDLATTNSDLRALMYDLTKASNHLEGIVSARLNITKANTEETNSWFGNGQVSLRDGLIWEIPIFGVFSSVLETFSKGLGTARISRASADFVITNSVIRSDNLDLRSSTMRLLYRGTVDFHLKVDAIVDADVGHDLPLVGPLFTVFSMPFSRLFETHVTGTISDPKYEPLRLGKLLSTIIHPWRTLKELGGGDSGNGTNSPPVWPTETPDQ